MILLVNAQEQTLHQKNNQTWRELSFCVYVTNLFNALFSLILYPFCFLNVKIFLLALSHPPPHYLSLMIIV
jgi:hypothetical protein